jgi:hypothetical protein
VSFGEIATALQVEIFHYPLAIRSAKAEMAFVNDFLKRQHDREVEESKKAKSKM